MRTRSDEAIDGLIAAEQERLDKLEEKQAEIAKRIKTCKANIDKFTLIKNQRQLTALSNVLDGKGISIEDILIAITAGDVLALKEKIEGGGT